MIIALTGLAGAGKSTVAVELAQLGFVRIRFIVAAYTVQGGLFRLAWGGLLPKWAAWVIGILLAVALPAASWWFGLAAWDRAAVVGAAALVQWSTAFQGTQNMTPCFLGEYAGFLQVADGIDAVPFQELGGNGVRRYAGFRNFRSRNARERNTFRPNAVSSPDTGGAG